MVARPIVVRNNFQVGLDINRIKIRHLKVKTNGKALEDPIQMDWTAIFLKEDASERFQL